MPRLQIDGRAVAQIDQTFANLLTAIAQAANSIGNVESISQYANGPVQRTIETADDERYEKHTTRTPHIVTVEIHTTLEEVRMVPIVRGRGK